MTSQPMAKPCAAQELENRARPISPTLPLEAAKLKRRRKTGAHSRGRWSQFKRPCVFHLWLSIQNKQGGMNMTLPSTARRAQEGPPVESEFHTGLAPIVRLDPEFFLRIPIRGRNLAHDSGQPCVSFLSAAAEGGGHR